MCRESKRRGRLVLSPAFCIGEGLLSFTESGGPGICKVCHPPLVRKPHCRFVCVRTVSKQETEVADFGSHLAEWGRELMCEAHSGGEVLLANLGMNRG